MKKIILLVIFFIAVFVIIFFTNKKPVTSITTPPTQTEQFKLISTNPNPLNESTILPTQDIELTFNKEVVRSEIKYKIDPEVLHKIEVINGKNDSTGTNFRIVFTKPLELGSGYTLFIYFNTHTNKINLDKEYIFHFSTIKYRGI